MAENLPKIYIDSCCFVESAKSELGVKLQKGRDEDVLFIKKLLLAAMDGKVELYTSSLSIAECLYANDSIDVEEETKRLFRSILTSGKVVYLIETHLFLMEAARDLLWLHKVKLGGADGVHVASALDAKCVEFITIDEKILSQDNIKTLEKLGLHLRLPRDTKQLPDNYIFKQQNILDAVSDK